MALQIIAFYSSTVFVQASFTPREALYASIGFGAVNFVSRLFDLVASC